jgi:hypothetical protein
MLLWIKSSHLEIFGGINTYAQHIWKSEEQKPGHENPFRVNTKIIGCGYEDIMCEKVQDNSVIVLYCCEGEKWECFLSLGKMTTI